MICEDFKIISVLLGQQTEYIKYPSFRCEWDSRADSVHRFGKVEMTFNKDR